MLDILNRKFKERSKCNATSKTREELGKECREKLSDIFVII